MLKWLLVAGAVVVFLLLGVVALVPWLLKTSTLQAYVAQAAARAIGRPVKFASLSVSALPLPTVTLRRLEVAEDPAFGPGPFLTVAEGRLGIRLRPLLSGRVELADLSLEAPRVDLLDDGHGRWNWASLGAPASATAGSPRTPGRAGSRVVVVLLSRVNIVGGSVRYRTLGMTRSTLGFEKIDMIIRQPVAGQALGLTGTAVVQPGNVDLTVRQASVLPMGGRALTDAALQASVDVHARDLAPLASLLDPSSSATGQIGGRLQISGTLGHVVATGAVGFDRVTLSGDHAQCLPRLRQLVLDEGRVPLAYSGGALVSAPLQVRVARGTVAVRVAATLGSVSMITLRDIAVRGVELEPILGQYLCPSPALTGRLDLTGSATFRADDPLGTINGAGRFRVGPGRVGGRDVSILVNQVLGLAGMATAAPRPARGGRPSSALDFDSITASYTITNGTLRTEDLLYETADAKVRGAGTVALDDGRVDMQLTLTQGANQVTGLVAGTPAALTVTPTAVRVPDSRGIRRFLETLFR